MKCDEIGCKNKAVMKSLFDVYYCSEHRPHRNIYVEEKDLTSK